MRQRRSSARTLGAGRRRLLGGYGPLLALSTAFVLAVTLVPTIAREQIVATAQGADGEETAAVSSARSGKSLGAAATNGTPKASATKRPDVAPSPKRAAASRRPATAVAAPPKAAGPCSGQRVQVVGDPYSPPCVAWPAGNDNGGATSRGVTRDTIRIGFRLPIEDILDFENIIRQFAGDKANKVPRATEEDVKRTIQAFITYFNRKFQTYGRTIELEFWQGKGSIFQEFLGGGREGAAADAIRAAKELNFFADLGALTLPYNEALARQKVVGIGAPYLSREWFDAHAPYAWSPYPDCTTLASTVAEYLNKRVYGHPADHAGPGVVGKARKLAVIAPDSAEYQQCLDTLQGLVDAAGNELTRFSYTPDLATLSDQAATLAAKVKQNRITSVVLLTDPLTPLLVTSRMSQQSYYPEWIVTGTALTDRDSLGQLYDAAQWKHAFGLSQLGADPPHGASFAYAAAKSVDPNLEPVFGADLFYKFCYVLATGIQMAGPNLTPESFAAGMRAYPGGTGIEGKWAYPPGAYGPNRDALEIWWDPTAKSVANGAPGRYATGDRRYLPGQWPTGPAAPEHLKVLARDPATRPDER